ncbi:SDR family oxidoreductase [Bordetella petrii]|uniref:SDR family oxidoreductase n=1 Tax=Bordetella petrii TaxID=94624 RepID=UPI001E3FDFC1|nr:SDR family oxidoreductase [Bordetella petrii]MCD0505164.1 SDR family oxidoreductase [Bordetella petrii]
MNILVTGAGGYIGRALVERLCAMAELPGHGAPTRITLCDLALGEPPSDPRVRGIEGSFADPKVLAAMTEPAPDLVFHLACVASGRAEEQFELGLQVNLAGSLQLLERLRQQGRSPGLVYTSSIAVFGAPLPGHVDDQTPAAPALSYGAHKLAMEILLADYTRRGFLQARTVRLPGIVPRPPAPNGAWSAFSSTLIRSLAAGQPCTMPVGPDATLWLMSRACCVDNLLNAAWLATQAPGARTAWTLPALRVSVRDIVAAFDARGDGTASTLVRYAPEPAIEAQFGSQPPLYTPAAEAAGFRHDGDLHRLLDHAAQAP